MAFSIPSKNLLDEIRFRKPISFWEKSAESESESPTVTSNQTSSGSEEKEADQKIVRGESNAIRTDQTYETDKQESWNRYCNLVHEKSRVEAVLAFQKKLAEFNEVRLREVEEKYIEQKGKNLKLTRKLAAEKWTVNHLSHENGELQEKCRNLEKEKFDLMEELREAKSANAYYRTLIMDML